MIEEPITEESRVETGQPSSPDESLLINVSGIPFFNLGDNATLHLSAQKQDIASIIFVNGSFVSGGDNDLIIGNDYINFISGGGAMISLTDVVVLIFYPGNGRRHVCIHISV